MTQLSASTGSDQFGFGLCSRAVEQDKMTYLMEAVLEIVIGLQLPVLSQVELSCYMCLLFHRCSMWYENVRGMYGLFHRSSSYTVYIDNIYYHIMIHDIYFVDVSFRCPPGPGGIRPVPQSPGSFGDALVDHSDGTSCPHGLVTKSKTG